MEESNLEVPYSPSNSKMKVSSKWMSHPAFECFVWNLFFKKLTAIEMYSSSLGFTKSTKALPLTMLQLRYLLFGSRGLIPDLNFLVELPPGADLPKLSEAERSPEALRFFFVGIEAIMSPRIPSLLSFSII